MRKYLGMTWKQVIEMDNESELLAVSNITDIQQNIGECIIIFPYNVSIMAECIDKGGFTEIIIKDDAIMCDLMDIMQNQKFKNLIGLKDASMIFNKTEGEIKEDIRTERLLENIEYIQIGKELIFDKAALERFYGKMA